MLVRPPKLTSTQQNQSGVYSQSHKSRTSVSKGKNKKKQSSLMPKNYSLSHKNNQSDRNSDRSGHEPHYQNFDNHSKEDDFGIKVNISSEDVKEKDNCSVGSYASAKSKKNKKKQTSLGKQRNRRVNYEKQLNLSQKEMQDSIKVMNYADEQYEQPVKQKYRHSQLPIIQQSQVKNVGINEPYQFRTINQNTAKPFTEMEDDDDLPVIKIQQKNIIEAKRMGTPKVIESTQTKKLGQIFEQNRKNVNYQGEQEKAIINNSSQISGSYWNNSNVNDSQPGQSRQSKSRLGALFKQKSRQKNANLPNQSKFDDQKSRSRSRSRGIFNSKNKNKSDLSINQSSLSTNKNFPQNASRRNVQQLQQSNNNKNAKLNTHASKYNYIQAKNLEESVDQFETGDLNKSQLNLSQSHNAGYMNSKHVGNSFTQKDSLCLTIQPEKTTNHKRKGLGLVSKKNNNPQQRQMIQISGDLQSISIGNAIKERQMVKIPAILESKPIDAHAKLIKNLRDNQKYLYESGFTNNNQQLQVTEYEKQREMQRERQIERQQQLRRQAQQRQREKKIRQEQRQKQEQKRKQEEQQKIKIQQQKQRRRRQEKAEIQRELQRAQTQKKLEQQKRQKLEDQQRQLDKRIQAEKQREKQERKRQIQKQKERQLQIQRKQEQKRLQKQQQLFMKNKQRQQERSQIPSLENLPSVYSKQQSSNGSQRSRSQGKVQRKKQSSINVKKNKRKFIGEISPRAEQSFYEQQSDNKGSEDQKIEPVHQTHKITKDFDQSKPKLISFSEEEDNVTGNQMQDGYGKYKTDSNFYENSVKAPSSRPPLSRKSVSSSKGKSRPKQTSLNPTKGKVTKVNPINKNQQISSGGGKKMSLVELALQKGYEPRSDSQYSNDNSQYSFGSRDQRSAGDRQYSNYSKNSRNSKKSGKKQSVISMKQNSLTNLNKPPSYRRVSPELINNKTMSHERSLMQAESDRQRSRIQEQNYIKPIVSRDCSFIDERGRLVQKDMVIKGNKVYGSGGSGFDPNQVYTRLRKSRQKRRSRSRERSLQRSRVSNSSQNITSANNTMQSFKTVESKQHHKNNPVFVQSEAYYDSAQSSAQNFYQSQNNFNASQRPKIKNPNIQMPSQNYSSKYHQKSSKNNVTALNEFLKPVQSEFSQTVPSRQTNDYQKNYQVNERNDRNQQESGYALKDQERAMKKKRMQRTQKSASKQQQRNLY